MSTSAKGELPLVRTSSASNEIAPEQSSEASARPLDIGELTIILRPMDMSMSQYIGTRMQLEAEGVIPAGTKWPDGYRDLIWVADGLRFHLRRERPEGAKGSRRDFIDCDNWVLRMQRPGSNWPDDCLKLQAEKLRQMLYAQSDEGRAAWNRRYKLYFAAGDDEKFQAFKALIPSLIPPPRKPRGRRPNEGEF
ncbi:hypothetical protein Bsp3421_004796 [Burkholderia sp. FERM BP-3421]|uniref:hypothetical protein n=1 Tax=Burkholderia sp. FERM BP-3421 TaxID=1494466 RepID=UPI00236261C7|nr:hypothetical protein [Burkholderia sp. FERM BP-3421]WDD94662.1 hypothetical protein Bsp3421_004796 [Burkholderia sp. FERM BP-3421]